MNPMDWLQKNTEELDDLLTDQDVSSGLKIGDALEQMVAMSAPESAPSFTLDPEALQDQGFYRPSSRPTRLSLELRAVKRRLLRQLDFQKRVRGRRAVGAEDDPRNLVLVTSTRPAEGKTFTSINLALSFAIEDNIGVVLVDADIPQPKVRRHLGLDKGPGLTDLIARPDEVRMRQALRRETHYPLAVLGEGEYKCRGHELFQTTATIDFFAELSARFPDRLIIVDAPPILATPEAVALAPYVHEIVFVVEAHDTPEGAIAAALDELLDANDRVSLVLNKCLVPENVVHYGSYEEYHNQQDRGIRRSVQKSRKKR